MAVSFGKGFGKGCGNSAFQAGAPASSVLKKNLRRSARVFLNLRLCLSVPVERGGDFLAEGKTIHVSQDGASIMADRDLGVGRTIKIRRFGANKGNLSLGNEVVVVSSLAREGVNFFSSNHYPEGASIAMAIPYTSKSPKVFSLVRIVGPRREKKGSLTEYRVGRHRRHLCRHWRQVQPDQDDRGPAKRPRRSQQPPEHGK